MVRGFGGKKTLSFVTTKSVNKKSKLPDDIKLGGEINGTSLRGYLTVSYAELVNLLGRPNMAGDRYKIDAQWAITVSGRALSIYNYKDGKNYLGSKGLPTKSITDWHIGGDGDIEDCLAYLSSLLPGSSYQIA